MIDFSNLTPEQKAFFNEMWENHQQESKQSEDSINSFTAYLERRRKQEDDQARAAEVLKSKMR